MEKRKISALNYFMLYKILTLFTLFIFLSACDCNKAKHVGIIKKSSNKKILLLVNCQYNINNDSFIISPDYFRIQPNSAETLSFFNLPSYPKNHSWFFCIFDLDSINMLYQKVKAKQIPILKTKDYRKYL